MKTLLEKRIYLIKYLLEESGDNDVAIPESEFEQRKLLRGLFNVRPPKEISKEFMSIQDEYLQEVIKEKGITDYKSLKQIEKDIYLWKGDITTIKCDAIVNAANSGMTGCYIPNHNCIDNCIHTYAGVELRNECNKIMLEQGHEEETGQAKITKGYNLPAKYVIHTVGPIINGSVTDEDTELLKSCYISSLRIAEDCKLKSIAFCSISTGVFAFSKNEAAKIAVKTIRDYKKENNSDIKVIFNVFTDEDYKIYRELLG